MKLIPELTDFHQPPREGALYRRVNVSGIVFEIYYGYYEDFERERHEPIPMYPDFRRNPVYTKEGIPVVTGMQDICPHYSGRKSGDSCISCCHFITYEDLFGLCICPGNRQPTGKETESKRRNSNDDL